MNPSAHPASDRAVALKQRRTRRADPAALTPRASNASGKVAPPLTNGIPSSDPPRAATGLAALTMACHAFARGGDGGRGGGDAGGDPSKPFQIGGRRRLLEAAVKLRRALDDGATELSKAEDRTDDHAKAVFEYCAAVSRVVFRHDGEDAAVLFALSLAQEHAARDASRRNAGAHAGDGDQARAPAVVNLSASRGATRPAEAFGDRVADCGRKIVAALKRRDEGAFREAFREAEVAFATAVAVDRCKKPK